MGLASNRSLIGGVGAAQGSAAVHQVRELKGMVAVDIQVAAHVGREPGDIGVEDWIAVGA
jgi:hypothetical protein